MCGCSCLKMISSLAVIGLIRALNIDNQLMVIKNDCYERLAIGQKLNSKDAFKTFNNSTLKDCQMMCTKEKTACRAFSYGISTKGNSSCLLTHEQIKETADLKPIGTIADTDYDLYIKKLDCSIVIDKNPHEKPLDASDIQSPYKPDTLGNIRPNDKYDVDVNKEYDHKKPVENGYLETPSYSGSHSYGSGSVSNYYLPVKPPSNNGDKVQTIVSVASGPDSYYHPVHDILVSDKNSYGANDKIDNSYGRPPFRPQKLPNPYENGRPNIPLREPSDGYGRPPPRYSVHEEIPDCDRPDHGHKPDISSGYDSPSVHRPLYPPNPRPDDYNTPYSYLRPIFLGYDRPDSKPKPSGYDRPTQNYNTRPSSPKPRPDGYDNPNFDARPISPQPIQDGYGRPEFGSRPVGPRPSSDGYDRPEQSYDSRPIRPNPSLDSYDRPDQSYYSRPTELKPRPDGYNTPHLDFRPVALRPKPQSEDRPDSSYGSKPASSKPKPNGYDNLDSGFKPIGYYESSYSGYGSGYGYGYGYGTGMTDRYDVRPERPSDIYQPKPPGKPYKPESSYGNLDRPNPDRYGQSKPQSDGYNIQPPKDYMFAPGNGYDNRPPKKPGYGSSNDDNPNYVYGRPSKPFSESEGYGGGGKPTSGSNTGYGKPTKPSSYDDSQKRPYKPSTGGYEKPSSLKPSKDKYDNSKADGSTAVSKPIVSHSVGYNGEQITSIITELKNACFRRVLAGKRVARAFVRRSLICETVEECQRECSDEKRFSCEGFNYRLDPTGRGKGECELLSVPLSHLDIGRDVYPDPDYDYYERDRNAASVNCKQPPRGYEGGYGNGYGGGGSYYADRRHDYGGGDRRPSYHTGLRRPGDRWPEDSYYHRPIRPEIDRRYDSAYDYEYRPSGNRRGDYTYHSHHTQQDHYFHDRHDDHRYSGIHYTPIKPHKPDPFEPYLPLNYHQQKDKDYWGLDNHSYGTYGSNYEGHKNHYYLPPNPEASNHWGLYDNPNGNSYHQYGSGYQQSYGYEYKNKWKSLPPPEHSGENSYLPKPVKPHYHNFVLPAEPRKPISYGFAPDECSLRMATGFRLHKGVVKKSYIVPNIYECEVLCFREKDFPCNSYAFRYTVNFAKPADNCYLSPRTYNELNYYTDLEPDRDFDIYTMNNKAKCQEPYVLARQDSDCFWRVRSGQRLDQKVVRDSLKAKSIVECQIECLKAYRFTCRSFSYRYGSPVIGGPIDNCQLTDWPYYELDPRKHFVPEPGFEIYERGSFGHGCEADHFGIRGHRKKLKPSSKTDQLCYIGFGTPAKLLPQATIKSVNVPTELDCKAECTKARDETLFQCMSFSFRTVGPTNTPNCKLSDIYQRDLLPNIDYAYDSDSWLFAWDNYNPECVAIAKDPSHTNHIGYENRIVDKYDSFFALNTWTVYSVSGWPCRRGSRCKENKEAGFWYCELEGGDKNTWDYCCRPDHQCGASHGYPYQWCYVGPGKTQWRKCSDRYFPYIQNVIDRLDYVPTKPYLPRPTKPWSPPRPVFRPGARPDRPPAPPVSPPPRPSLDEYEAQFDEQFLDPPKPGGFGQPRHWPLSYLHKEMPPNITDSEPKLMRMENKLDENPKYAAIQNLINVIKKNDLNNIQYHISNDSNKESDILFVKIPLPTNFSQEIDQKKSEFLTNTSINLEPIDLRSNDLQKRSEKSLSFPDRFSSRSLSDDLDDRSSLPKLFPVYRRGFVTKTNVSSHARMSF